MSHHCLLRVAENCLHLFVGGQLFFCALRVQRIMGFSQVKDDGAGWCHLPPLGHMWSASGNATLTAEQGGQGLTLLVRHKDDAKTAVLKQCKCDNISAANDALREVQPPMK